MVLRVGVVGAGGMGREHVANLRELSDVEVVVVADVVPAAAQSAAALADAASSTDPLAVARSADLDAIVIASPDETHADLAVAALEAGHYVLCEKPLASNVADAARVVEAESLAGGALLQLGFMRHYDPAHRQMFGELAELGPVDHVRCVHRNTNAHMSRDLELVLSQSLIHDVHTVRWMSGDEFTSVVTQVVSRVRRVDHVVVLGALASGATATIEFVEVSYGYDIEVEITAADTTVVCAQPSRPVVRRGGAAHRFIGDDWFGRFRDAYRLEAADWAAGVLAGEVRGPNGADGLAAQRVVAAASASARSGRRETV